jgi:hypothetical protein
MNARSHYDRESDAVFILLAFFGHLHFQQSFPNDGFHILAVQINRIL